MDVSRTRCFSGSLIVVVLLYCTRVEVVCWFPFLYLVCCCYDAYRRFLFVLTIYISNTYFNIFIAANVVGIFRVRSILFCPQVCTAVGIYLCFCWSFCGQIKLRKKKIFPLPDAPEKT